MSGGQPVRASGQPAGQVDGQPDLASQLVDRGIIPPTMGELKFFLGFEIKQYDEGTFICQEKYIQDMLKKFDMRKSSPLRFPMATNLNLTLVHEGIPVDQKLYRSMIGSLF